MIYNIYSALRHVGCIGILMVWCLGPQSLLAAEEEPHILIQMKEANKIFLEAESNYTDVIRVVAALAGKQVEIINAPKSPLSLRYSNKTREEAFNTLMRSSILSVTRRGEVYVIRSAEDPETVSGPHVNFTRLVLIVLVGIITFWVSVRSYKAFRSP